MVKVRGARLNNPEVVLEALPKELVVLIRLTEIRNSSMDFYGLPIVIQKIFEPSFCRAWYGSFMKTHRYEKWSSRVGTALRMGGATMWWTDTKVSVSDIGRDTDLSAHGRTQDLREIAKVPVQWSDQRTPRRMRDS